MKFIGIAIALRLAASIELEVDLLSIFDTLKRKQAMGIKHIPDSIFSFFMDSEISIERSSMLRIQR